MGILIIAIPFLFYETDQYMADLTLRHQSQLPSCQNERLVQM